MTGPWLIKVDNGESTAEIVEEEAQPYFDPEVDFSDYIVDSFGTIDKLYDTAISQLEEGVANVILEVDFKEFIITEFSVDINETYIDDEYVFTVSDYKEL